LRRKNKLVFGFGVNDAQYEVYQYDKSSKRRLSVCPYYVKWVSILARCYGEDSKRNRTNYVNCYVSEDWRLFSSFVSWVNSQPNQHWRDCEPDKDILIEGNQCYDPKTVAFLPKKVNVFVTDSFRGRGKFLIGVSKNTDAKSFTARCSDPFGQNKPYIGVFETELAAHLAWKAKKHEYACRLAELQEDPRVADALRQRYAPDKDWTNK
jgi:hypothetical protein